MLYLVAVVFVWGVCLVVSLLVLVCFVSCCVLLLCGWCILCCCFWLIAVVYSLVVV